MFESASDAVFSRNERYRYGLWRNWNPNTGKVLFIGLNPSTADHEVNDPTIRRCIAFAQRWDFGGVLVGNLFAYRATRPAELRKASKPVGPDNEKWLLKMAAAADLVIACWGNHGSYLNQDQSTQKLFPKLHCLKLNTTGAPAHPLYLRKTLKPVPYKSIKRFREGLGTCLQDNHLSGTDDQPAYCTSITDDDDGQVRLGAELD